MADWDARFMDLVEVIGSWSKDRSNKVGCVIVGPDNEIRSVGYNGFVRGIDDDDERRHARPAKYQWTEHSERNAIYHAALAGTALKGCRMYLSWFPCVDCARAIIQSGIVELIAVKRDFGHERWSEDFPQALELFKETGVRVRFYDSREAERHATDRL